MYAGGIFKQAPDSWRMQLSAWTSWLRSDADLFADLSGMERGMPMMSKFWKKRNDSQLTEWKERKHKFNPYKAGGTHMCASKSLRLCQEEVILNSLPSKSSGRSSGEPYTPKNKVRKFYILYRCSSTRLLGLKTNLHEQLKCSEYLGTGITLGQTIK